MNGLGKGFGGVFGKGFDPKVTRPTVADLWIKTLIEPHKGNETKVAVACLPEATAWRDAR